MQEVWIVSREFSCGNPDEIVGVYETEQEAEICAMRTQPHRLQSNLVVYPFVVRGQIDQLCHHCMLLPRRPNKPLCRRCFADLGASVEDEEYSPDPALKLGQPTDHCPGDPLKVEVMARRYANGEEIFHPDDSLQRDRKIKTRRSNHLAGVRTTGLQVRNDKDRCPGKRVRVRGEIYGRQIEMGTFDLATESDVAQQMAMILQCQQAAARRDRKMTRECRRRARTRLALSFSFA